MNQLDVAALRRDFPVLDRTIYGKPLIYLDNTATSQTPSCVVDTIRDISTPRPMCIEECTRCRRR